MSVTLSKGFKKPQTGDSGATFFPDLEFDIQQLNDHDHDGVDSPKLSVVSSEALLQANAGGAWASNAGTYRKLINLPSTLTSAGYTLDKVNLSLRDSSNGAQIFIGNERVSPTSFYVYSNDNSLSVDVVYTT